MRYIAIYANCRLETHWEGENIKAKVLARSDGQSKVIWVALTMLHPCTYKIGNFAVRTRGWADAASSKVWKSRKCG